MTLTKKKHLLDKVFFKSDSNGKQGYGTPRQASDTAGTDWEDRAEFTMLHLLVRGCCGGRGHWCGRAFAIIRERIGRECLCAVFMHQPVFLIFSVFFVHGLCRYCKPWRVSCKQQGTPSDVCTRYLRSVRMHISLRSSLPPLQCCNTGLFFFVWMKVQITQ